MGIVLAKAKFEINHDASFSIIGTDGFRLDSGNYMFRKEGKTYSTVDKSLEVSFVDKSQGTDVLGNYTEHSFYMGPASNDVTDGMEGMMAFIRNYEKEKFAVFRQHFHPGFKGMSLGSLSKVTTSFPSVKVPQSSESLYINPCDDMGGYERLRKGTWDVKNMTDMCAGKGDESIAHPSSDHEGALMSGQIHIFDKTNVTIGHLGQIFTISAFSKFTVHFTEINHDNSELWFGLPGTTDKMPEDGFDIETIISYSDQGFYEGVQKWGSELKTKYGKDDSRRETDDTVNYLSYWTDNGAFYYYNTEPQKNYADTMRDVYSQIRHGDTSAPFRSWNFDSWWYPKCDNGAVKTWVSMDEVFPEGMEVIYQETSLPVVAHNRWWCNETTYAKRNGGQYNFVFNDETGTAVPHDPQFWEDLFKNSSAWGLEVYLQDWLNEEANHLPIFEGDLNLERDWLIQMGDGAAANGINVLYCMSYPRQMLQSVEIQNVVSLRASGDYQPGNDQWQIGLTSAWVYALGLSPFKDTFWTTAVQPGSPYGNDTEWHPALESVVATLSTGIVGISDKIGHTDMNLVAKSIRPDGLILKPSRPLVIPDFLIWELDTRLYLNGTTEYETWSEVAGQRFGIIMGYNPGKPDKVSRQHILSNYQFQRNTTCDYIATLVTYPENKPLEKRLVSSQKWKRNEPLSHNTFRDMQEQQGIILVSWLVFDGQILTSKVLRTKQKQR